MVEDRPNLAERFVATVGQTHRVDLETTAETALARAVGGRYDLAVVSSTLKDFDPLRLCSQLRSLERTRELPILLLADTDDRARILRALDIGVNDYIARPIDWNELMARVRIQLRRKRYADRLRDIMQESLQLAVIDPLTGLHNRRFLESNLGQMIESAVDGEKPLSLMILDIDHFKAVNDTHGHDAGDEILRAFAERIKTVIRGVDLLCRLGGEEFIIVMPEHDARGSREGGRAGQALHRSSLVRHRQRDAADPRHGLDRPRGSSPGSRARPVDEAGRPRALSIEDVGS